MAGSRGFTIRQRYNYGPKDPRYLALTDLDLRIEILALEAYNELLSGKAPSSEQTLASSKTEEFDDLSWALENDLLSDEEWEELSNVQDDQETDDEDWDDTNSDQVPLSRNKV